MVGVGWLGLVGVGWGVGVVSGVGVVWGVGVGWGVGVVWGVGVGWWCGGWLLGAGWDKSAEVVSHQWNVSDFSSPRVGGGIPYCPRGGYETYKSNLGVPIL